MSKNLDVILPVLVEMADDQRLTLLLERLDGRWYAGASSPSGGWRTRGRKSLSRACADLIELLVP